MSGSARKTGEALHEEQAPLLAVSKDNTPHPHTLQAPLAPAFAFTGEVKRTEWYSTVSPALLERAFTTARAACACACA